MDNARERIDITDATLQSAEKSELLEVIEQLQTDIAVKDERIAELQTDLDRSTAAGIILAKNRYSFLGDLEGKDAEINMLERLKDRDPMTGLLNKEAWIKNIETMIDNKEDHFGVLFIDLNRFKRVNDVLGHAKGDELITKTANLLVTTLRATPPHNDTLAHERLSKSPEDLDYDASRYGGDEFAILCDLTPRKASALPDEFRLEAIIERIRESFNEMLDDEEPLVRRLGFDIAIGGSIYKPGMTIQELLLEADHEMFIDKSSRLTAWNEKRPLIKRIAYSVGRTLMRAADTLDDRHH
jgi:GGDEF domain-containing protein